MDGWITIGTKIDNKNFDKQIDALETKIERAEKDMEIAIKNKNPEVAKQIGIDIEKMKNKLVSLKKQQDKVNSQGFDKFGNSVESSIKKVGRLVLGVFSIASAYRFVSQASGTLAQYDKQYASNLEYIRFALAQGIAPVLRYLVNLAGKLLSYLNYILNAWFGINMFSKASAKNFAKGAGSAKEIRKSLAGFDEMNVAGSASSGTGGVGMPSMDISGINEKQPAWLEWIAENKDIILSALGGIAGAITAIRLGLGGIKALGIGVIIFGVIKAVQDLLKYLKEPTWENFGKLIQSIGIVVIGLGVAFLGLPAIIAGVAILVVGTIVRFWEQIKGFFQNGIDWLQSKSDFIREKFGDTAGEIYDHFVDALRGVLTIFDSFFSGVKKIFDGIIMLITGVFTGNWKKAWEGLKMIVSGVFEGVVGILKGAITTIVDMVVVVGKTAGSIISSTFKAVVNGILSAIESILNNPIRTINSLISVINAVPGINLRKLSTFKLPRLAVGGIVNMPGKGIPIGGAIAGEAGPEGVIPLTDSQAMETLGQAIGRYITINANIVNNMNGRTISKELQRIKGQQDFAYNT